MQGPYAGPHAGVTCRGHMQGHIKGHMQGPHAAGQCGSQAEGKTGLCGLENENMLGSLAPVVQGRLAGNLCSCLPTFLTIWFAYTQRSGSSQPRTRPKRRLELRPRGTESAQLTSPPAEPNETHHLQKITESRVPSRHTRTQFTITPNVQKTK